MHNGRRAFQRLHQVGVNGVFEQSGHSAVSAQVACVHRFTGIGICHQNIAQPFFQVFPVVRQAQNGHNFAGHRNDEPIFPGNPVNFAAQAHNDVPQRPVVHIHTPFNQNAALINPQRIALVHVVIQHGTQQVIRRRNGVHVAGEVEVDVLHGHHLGIPAASGPAFHTEHRP